jgi:hypothetical protein
MIGVGYLAWWLNKGHDRRADLLDSQDRRMTPLLNIGNRASSGDPGANHAWLAVGMMLFGVLCVGFAAYDLVRMAVGA